MVEINNQRKAFLDMLAWSEGTDNGRRETRNHGYDVIVEESYLPITRSPSQTCHANPKLNHKVDATSFFPARMLTAKRIERLLRKSGCALRRLRSGATFCD